MNVAETAQTVAIEYNGWSNYETWVVNLWITNTQQYCEELCRIVSSKDDLRDKAEALEDWLRFEYDGEYSSLWADLINNSLAEVNWYEIIEKNQE
jgi:aromatic ring hydroxylase